jgi:antitoxin component of RelBE/YafQ-DinJ toxin-antitoxin module
MPETIRFHLDENISASVADGLKRRGIDVTTTVEVGLMAVAVRLARFYEAWF